MTTKKQHDNDIGAFSKPAIYKIKVRGELPVEWSDRMGGLQITINRKKKKGPVTVLIGKLSDQAELSGILNSLYKLKMNVLSINMLKHSI